MTEIKITKAMVLAAIKKIVAEDANIQVDDVTVKGSDIIAYCDTAIEQIEQKAAKAKERAAKNKAEGDFVTEQIYDYLTDEFQTAEDILANFDADSEMTKSKIVAKLSSLVRADRAVKDQIKTEDGRKLMNYKRA